MLDEDPDPVEEIRAVRRKIMRKYKTLGAYFDHLPSVPSADELLAQVTARIGKANANRRKRRPASVREG